MSDAQPIDPYVRRTRPMIARVATYAAGAYLLLMEGVRAFEPASPGADMELLGVLLAPVGFYMTMRTVDSFSPHKGPRT